MTNTNQNPIINTECLSCGKKFSKRLSWFEKHSECPSCGGELDRKEMLELCHSALQRFQKALKQQEGSK
jgi:rRNA maturation endonuclease Nob1